MVDRLRPYTGKDDTIHADLTAHKSQRFTDPDRILFLFGLLERLDELKKKAAADVATMRKHLGNSGVTLAVLDQAMRTLNNGPEAVDNYMAEFHHITQSLQPRGTQFGLFDAPVKAPATPAPVVLPTPERIHGQQQLTTATEAVPRR